MKVVFVLFALAGSALAQTATTGAVTGAVADDKTGDLLGGVTIVATSPALQGEQVVLSDDKGQYLIAGLPPGTYKLTFYYADKAIERTADVVANQAAAVHVRFDTTTSPEVIRIETDEGCLDCHYPFDPPPPPIHIESNVPPVAHAARAQAQADLGLAVIGLAYEQPIGEHYAVQIEAQAFSTYFAPWFSAGDRVDGFGGQLRPTWFRNRDHHGLYLAPYVRIDRVTHDMAAGVGFAAGGFAGYAFGVGPLDVRVGGGAQYLRYFAGPFGLSTPFVALDLVVGYRL